MTLSYESAEDARQTRQRKSSFAMACGAVLMFLAWVGSQVPIEVFDDHDRLAVIFFLVALPVAVGIGFTLLNGVLSAAVRRRWARLEYLSAVCLGLWLALALMELPRWLTGEMLYVRLALSLAAGTLLHSLLGWRMWRRAHRLLALQLFVLAILLPLSMIAPFFDPNMQGPSGLGLVPFARVLPALGVPHYPGEFLLTVMSSFARDPGNALQSFLQSLLAEPYIGPALITPIWAAGIMATLAVLFVRDAWRRPAPERTA